MTAQEQEIQRLRAEIARLSAERSAILAEKAEMRAQMEGLMAEKAEMQSVIDDLRAQMAWFRRKFFGSMSEKRLPLEPNALTATDVFIMCHFGYTFVSKVHTFVYKNGVIVLKDQK